MHALAPICGQFVTEMREVFGDVYVLMVNEGTVNFDKRK
jgi:hypothetical protein